jgi:hypothetical protein
MTILIGSAFSIIGYHIQSPCVKDLLKLLNGSRTLRPGNLGHHRRARRLVWEKGLLILSRRGTGNRGHWSSKDWQFRTERKVDQRAKDMSERSHAGRRKWDTAIYKGGNDGERGGRLVMGRQWKAKEGQPCWNGNYNRLERSRAPADIGATPPLLSQPSH